MFENISEIDKRDPEETLHILGYTKFTKSDMVVSKFALFTTSYFHILFLYFLE
jgi:hypothetical protein